MARRALGFAWVDRGHFRIVRNNRRLPPVFDEVPRRPDHGPDDDRHEERQRIQRVKVDLGGAKVSRIAFCVFGDTESRSDLLFIGGSASDNSG